MSNSDRSSARRSGAYAFHSGTACALTTLTATTLVAFLSLVMVAAPVAASDPAVRAQNFRVFASYDYVHVESEETNSVGGPIVVFPERDVDLGSITGIATIPLAHAFGLRIMAGPEFAKDHLDTLPETNSAGLAIGGDLFWRDPAIGELGIGPRYEWIDSEQGGTDRTTHSFGGAITGSLFLPDFGFGPLDLDVEGSFTDNDLDSAGAFSTDRVYAFGGLGRLYLSDIVALGVGGHWSRNNLARGENVTIRAGDLSLEILLPFDPKVTLGALVSFGEREESRVGVSNFGTDFFSLGLNVTVSFPGADSLVELNRSFY